MKNKNFVTVILFSQLLFIVFYSGCGSKGQIGVRPGTGGQGALDPVFVSAKDSVFLIGSQEAGYQGTAFLIEYKNRKYLITNFHVTGFLKSIFIESENKVAYKDVVVLATDRKHDVAVLEVRGLPSNVKGLPYTHNFWTSQKIFVVGFPDMRSKENHLNFGTGVIADANYMAPFYMGRGEAKNIQITAPINPGHSGSPVLNERAEVVGVVSWRFSSKADIQAGNYAVPFQYVTDLLEEIERRKGDIASTYPEGTPCSDDSDCNWLFFCLEGKCQKLRDAGEPCSIHGDCYLPFNCFSNVCSKSGALGDICTNDSQCLPPNYCILGSCRPLGQKGDACKVDNDCEAPLYCIVGKCVPTLSSKNGPCSQNVDCVAPLACVGGTCQEVSGKGCSSDSECYPLYCILGKCKNLGKEGEACASKMDCEASFNCVSGICKAVPLSGMGGPCSSDNDCVLPLYCISGQCKDQAGVVKSNVQGTPCTSDIQCQPPLYCILNTCRPLGNQGDPCAIDGDCNMPFYCIGGVCSVSPGGGNYPQGGGTPLGGACQSDSDCAPPNYCILGSCRPLGNKGDKCSYDGDCNMPLYCIAGVCSESNPVQGGATGINCTSDYECTPPLYCILGKCRELGKTGDPCGETSDCNVPFVCVSGVCSSSGKQQGGMGGAGIKGGGSSSVSGTPCASDADCAPPLYCINKLCKHLGKVGDECKIDADCSMPLICKASKCTNPSGGGSTIQSTGGDITCKTDEDCKKAGKGLKHCINSKCKKALSGEGEECVYASDCKKGLFCIVGVCRAEKSGSGGACRSNDDCKKPYLCKDFVCSQ